MKPAPPLRILHLIPHLGLGGAELQLHQLITHTPPSAASHQVLFYTEALDREAERLFRESGIAARRIPRSRLAPIAFVARLARAIREAEPDVVCCWLVSACFWGRLAARRAGVRRLVLSFRSSHIEHARVLRWISRLGDEGVFYLANTGAVATSMTRTLGVPRERITVVHNGVAAARRAEPAGAPRGADAPSPAGTRTILSVGRLTFEKNYPMLLRVVARFGADEGVRFAIVGHGALDAALRRQAEALGLGERLRFLGLRHDVPDLMRSHRLFAFTSRIEGSPNALLEAMAEGRPIVSTRFDGVEDILTHDHDALLVETDDDAGFEAALRRLLADPGRAETLGANARRTVETRFGIPAMVDASLAFYRTILDAPS